MKESATNTVPTSTSAIEGFNSIPHIASTKTVEFPLKEYVFMSSWNSAVDEGQNVTLETLEKTLVRGYRFIDLEIYLVNDQPQVGFSTQKNYNTMETAPLLLFDALGLIMSKAFSVDNGKDPLFIHLRIKSLKMDIFTKLADAISLQLGNRLYKYNLVTHSNNPSPTNSIRSLDLELNGKQSSGFSTMVMFCSLFSYRGRFV